MTDTLRDLLRMDAAGVEIPVFDPHDVIGRAERRRRRHRVAGALAAVSAVAAVAIAGAVLGSGEPRSVGPADVPPHGPRAEAPRSRPIVWSDDLDRGRVGTLHVGDQTVDIGQELTSVLDWSMSVTDAGAVYAHDDGSVWFTDGDRPTRIARKACAVAAGAARDLGLATGNTGALVAWFDCEPGSRGDLVVYDTAADHEVVRHRVPWCDATAAPMHLPASGSACLPDALVGDHVYFTHLQDGQDAQTARQFRYDLTSGLVEPSGQAAYREDLRGRARTLVVGASRLDGTPSEARGVAGGFSFRPAGRRLVPVEHVDVGEAGAETRVFDGATARPVELRLPEGYQPTPADVPVSFFIFEWLDDDTVALAESGFSTVGDVLVCHLSDGRCRSALTGAGIVPGMPLPG